MKEIRRMEAKLEDLVRRFDARINGLARRNQAAREEQPRERTSVTVVVELVLSSKTVLRGLRVRRLVAAIVPRQTSRDASSMTIIFAQGTITRSEERNYRPLIHEARV